MSNQVEEYEEQYNAAHDFAIFEVGDRTKGGHMTLAQKLNQADLDASMSQSNGTYRSIPDNSIDQPNDLTPAKGVIIREVKKAEIVPHLPEDKEIQSMESIEN